MEGDEELLAFAEVMRRLRAECPWKAAQTHRSLARYLLEESHEAIEALDTGDAALLREELGDLLLQVFLHTAIAEEAGEFSLGDVAADATAKMVRRNPHVFAGDVDDLAGAETGTETGAEAGREAGTEAAPLTPEAVNEEWERRKAAEKAGRRSVLDGLPPGLPALLLADKVLDRLGRAGAGPEGVDPVEDPVDDPGTGTGDADADQVGAELLRVVARAQAGGVDPEQALRDAVRRLVALREG